MQKKVVSAFAIVFSLSIATPAYPMGNPYIEEWNTEKRCSDCLWWTACGVITLASFYHLTNAPATLACLTSGTSCETIDLVSCCPSALAGLCYAYCCCKEPECDKRQSFRSAQAYLYCCAQAPRPSTRRSKKLSHDLNQLDRVQHFLAYIGCADERTEIGQQCNATRDKLRSELRNRERPCRLAMQ